MAKNFEGENFCVCQKKRERGDVKGNKRSERQKREKRFFFVLFSLKMESEKEGACPPDGDSFYGRSFNVLKDPASAEEGSSLSRHGIISF